MSGSNLVVHAEQMRNEAERRANVGARPGILEVVDDAARFGVALHLVKEAVAVEVEAVGRFPFHPAVLQSYQAALDALDTAATTMMACHTSIEDIHQADLGALRNPQHQNAQMWDHSLNNGTNGGA